MKISKILLFDGILTAISGAKLNSGDEKDVEMICEYSATQNDSNLDYNPHQSSPSNEETPMQSSEYYLQSPQNKLLKKPTIHFISCSNRFQTIDNTHRSGIMRDSYQNKSMHRSTKKACACDENLRTLQEKTTR